MVMNRNVTIKAGNCNHRRYLPRLVDWTRNGTLAEYVAVEARNLAPLPADIDHTVAAALPISGLTAWQALFDHGRLTTGQTVLIHGAAGGVQCVGGR